MKSTQKPFLLALQLLSLKLLKHTRYPSRARVSPSFDENLQDGGERGILQG